MVRSMLFHGPGRPMELVRLPTPGPSGQELLVRVLVCTLCRSDAMAQAAGAHAVLVSDPEPDRLERASAFGATHTFPAEPAELAARVAEATGGRGADLVIEVAGVAASVQAALPLVRTGGTVVLAGIVSPVGNVSIDPEQMVRRMVTIRGVHNYHPRDLQSALSFLAGPGRAFPFSSLIARDYPLEQAEEAFAHAHSHPGIRVAVVP